MENLTTLKLLDELEKLRSDIFAKLNNTPLEHLNFKDDPAVWSILEILYHIVSTEKLTLISIKKRLNNLEHAKKTGRGSSIRTLILKLALKSNLKFKAPNIVSNPPAECDFENIKKDWILIRNNFREILKTFKLEWTNLSLFKHPYAGNMNIIQTLVFLKEHFLHHQKKIEKLLLLSENHINN